MSCEEWIGRLRRSISGSTPPRVVGELDQRETPELVTVEEFHRECVRVVAKLRMALVGSPD